MNGMQMLFVKIELSFLSWGLERTEKIFYKSFKEIKHIFISFILKQVCHNNMYHLLTRVFFVINCLHIFMYSTKTILKKK